MSRLRLISLVVLVLLYVSSLVFFPVKSVFAQNKVGVNITDNFSAIDQAVELVNSDGQSNGGWVVLMPKIGNCTDLTNILKKYEGKVNFIIRLHYPDTVPSDDYALSWASTLVKLAESTKDTIYVYPWNEPNMPRECGGNTDCVEKVRQHVEKLREHLEAYGLWQTKIKILSPMINQSGPNFQPFVSSLGNDFFSQFQGQTMNMYDFEKDTGGQACRNTNPILNACNFEYTLGLIPGGQSPAYGVEVGIVDESGTCPTQVTDCPIFEDNKMLAFLKEAYDNHWFNNPNIAMASPLFYNPEISTHPVWLWGSQSEKYLKSVARRRQGAVFQYPYNASQANQVISQLINNGTLKQCANSCGIATSESLCQAAYGNTTQDFEGYDTSLYDDYNSEQDQFYIHPIKGLNRAQDGSQGAFDVNLKTIRDDLITQGYESRCATPGFNIELTQDGKDWMADYVEQNPPGAVFGGHENYIIRTRAAGDAPGIGDYVRSWLAVDYREVQTPVFRDVSDKRFLMTSLEEFFGFKDTVIQEQSPAELNSAAINSLLTNQQRCEASVRILLRQEEMCKKLANPNACALYSRPVPQTSYTIKTMLEAYRSLVAAPPDTIKPNPLPPYTDPTTIKAICNELVGSTWDENARQGLLYTPLTIDRAYRLAFLVTTIEVLHPNYKSMFNFYIHPNEGPAKDGPSKPDDAVLVNAFKVPDILTTTQAETSGSGGSGNTAWTDTSKLTRNSLITEKNQGLLTSTANAKIAELKKAASHYDTNKQKSGVDEIYCLEGVSNRGIGPPECKDELGKAVIDIINAQASNRVTAKYDNQIDTECPELIKEPANNIFDFGSFGPVETIKNPPAQLLYTQEFGAQLLHNIFEVPEKNQDPAGLLDSSHQIEPKGDSHPSFAETWKPGDPRAETNDIAPGEPNSEWGLKSLFHVVTETYPNFPYNACCDVSEVKHFLVYPMGYDMQKVQEVLAGTFFTTDQIASLTTASEEFDRIQLSGDQIDFTGGTREYTFADIVKGEPISGNKLNWPDGVDFISVNDPAKDSVFEIDRCQKVYETICDDIDPITGVRTNCHLEHVGWELPCDRTFGWEIKQRGNALAAGLLGGRFGFWLREIQKGLNTKAGTAREYLDTCKTVEQFLTGHCGQPVDPVPTPDPPDPDCTELSCTPPTPVPPTATPMPPTPMPTTPPQPGCAYSACFSMCANRNATGTVTVNFAWTGDNNGCACGDISDNEIIINGTSHGQPTCINVISSSMPNRSCSFDNQPANTVVCRKKGRYYCTEPFCDACREQSDLEMCVVAVQQ